MSAILSPDPGSFHQQAEVSSTLPADWYFDPAIYELEHQRIFYRSWWYLCHQSRVDQAGARYVDKIGERPVELLNSDGELQAWCLERRVRLENYAGFLFVNLDDDAVPLKQQASAFIGDMYDSCPELDQLVPVRRFEREIAANWKTLIDNNHECYHCEANHKSLMQMVDYRNQAVWSDDGITFSHKVERNDSGASAYRIDQDSAQQTSLFGYIWPNLIPLFFPGTPSLIMFQVIPLAPERSLVRHDFYLTSSTPGQRETEFMDWFSNVLNVEDVSLCENVQKGLHSLGYRQGRLIVDRNRPEISEHHVHFFQSMVKRALVD